MVIFHSFLYVYHSVNHINHPSWVAPNDAQSPGSRHRCNAQSQAPEIRAKAARETAVLRGTFPGNHRKTIGKPQENHRKNGVFSQKSRFRADLIAKLMHIPCLMFEFTGDLGCIENGCWVINQLIKASLGSTYKKMRKRGNTHGTW